MAENQTRDIRPSPIAGLWYPGDPEVLRQVLEEDLRQAKPPLISGAVKALILPHAGLVYSGKTAACALKAIEGKNFRRVIIVSPSHEGYPGHIITTEHSAYQTPLGLVPVDQPALQKLGGMLAAEGVRLLPVRRDREHSIEIELPFLQHLLPEGFELIPLMLMDQSLTLAKILSGALASLIESFSKDEAALLIASSDLSHFHHQRQANRLDQNLIKGLENFEPEAFYRLKSGRDAEACGHGAIASILLAAQKLGANQLVVTDYRTSGDVSGDLGSVVGYVSAVITAGEEERQ